MTQLRGLQWLSFTDKGVVQTLTSTSDSGGGASQSWSNGGTISCRIDPLAGQSRITGGAIDERSTHLVHTPVGTTIGLADRFAITGRGTFEVTATGDQTGELSSSFEVIKLQ